MFYSAMGDLINKDKNCKTDEILPKEIIQYKANGNLIYEKDEKEEVKYAVKLPSQKIYNSDDLGIKRRYIEE